MIKYHFRWLGKNERGAAMIEFALVAMLLLILLFGIIEFGWIFFGWITLTGAVREGVRLAVVGIENDDIEKKVEEHALPFDINNISITDEGTIYEGTFTVEATGDLPLLVRFFFDEASITITAEATMKKESN